MMRCGYTRHLLYMFFVFGSPNIVSATKPNYTRIKFKRNTTCVRIALYSNACGECVGVYLPSRTLYMVYELFNTQRTSFEYFFFWFCLSHNAAVFTRMWYGHCAVIHIRLSHYIFAVSCMSKARHVCRTRWAYNDKTQPGERVCLAVGNGCGNGWAERGLGWTAYIVRPRTYRAQHSA